MNAPLTPTPRRVAFLTTLSVLGGSYLVLIVALLVADISFASPQHFLAALTSPEIRYSIWLSLISCSVSALLSLIVAVPLGYLLSRYRFPGSQPDRFPRRHSDRTAAAGGRPELADPVSTPLGRHIDALWRSLAAPAATYVFLPAAALLLGMILVRVVVALLKARPSALVQATLSLLLASGILAGLGARRGTARPDVVRDRISTGIPFAVPAVILAQFTVACAFAVRTMRVAFDEIPLRREQVALTLGCSHAQAFWRVTMPEARRGAVTAGTLASARSLGEFGPLLVFAGATRMKTEVLSTTVFLELSVGNLGSAVAVSLLMVAASLLVLLVVRLQGTR